MKGNSLELYKVFREIGNTGNLTRAAEKLYVSQPNISAALKSLEERLQTVLCVRTKKGVALTYEGRVLYEELDRAFNHIASAEAKLQKLAQLESGMISLSASDTICNYYLLPYITLFTERYPGIRLEISNRTSLETAALVKSGQADLGFINLPYDDPALSVTVCKEVLDVVIGGAKYAYLADIKPSLAELSKYPFVMLERKSTSRLCLDRFFEEAGIALSPVLELGSLDLVVSFVRNNMGLAFIPLELCGRLIDGTEIVLIETAELLPARAIGLIELKGMTVSKAAEQFKQTVLGQA